MSVATLSLCASEAARAAPTAYIVGSRAPTTKALTDEERYGNFGRVQPLWVVVDTPYELWNGAGSYVHVAVYDRTFRPVSGAVVYVDEKPVGATDWRGALVFWREPEAKSDDANAGGGSRLITAVAGSGKSRAVGQIGFESYPRTSGFESTQLHVYTDRGYYSPGEAIELRFIAWTLRGDYAPLADKAIDVLLLDDRGVFVGGGNVFSNAYGTGSFRFPLPRSLREGRYELRVRFEEATASTNLYVETIRTPTLSIEHDLPRYVGKSLAAWPMKVSVRSFAGNVIRAGKLVLNLEHNGTSVEKLERDLAAAQTFDLTWSANTLSYVRERVGEGTDVIVSLQATDEHGRTDTVRRAVLVTERPYRATIEADKDDYVLGEIAKVQVKITDIDDLGVPNLPVQLVAADKTFTGKTDDHGIALFDVPVSATDTELSASVADVATPLASASLHALDKKPLLSKVTTPLVRERKSVPIEVVVDPGYEPVEPYLHGDIVDSSGSLVSAFLLPVRKEKDRYIARGTFVAPSWGTMLLTLFCAARPVDSAAQGKGPRQPVGLLTDGQQITVIPDRTLQVTLSGVPKEAKPGQKLSVRGRVVEARGAAASAAVGVSVVDAGVLSLLDPLEIRPEPRFYNPELKVLASTGSKILTWPVVSRNWGPSQMDIALPPFGFLDGDPEIDRLAEEEAGSGAGNARSATGAGSLGIGAVGSGGGGLGVGMAHGASGEASSAAQGRIAKPESVIATNAAAPVITFRKNFAPTSLWLGDAETSGGAFGFEVTLPDAITEQTITVVASDKKGGIGTLRQSLPVRQELSVRSDAPVELRVGDRVALTVVGENRGSTPLEATLSLTSKSPELILGGEAKAAVTLPAQGSAAASFDVTADKIGEATFDVRLTAGSKIDIETRTLRIRPRGVFSATSESGTSSATQAFTTKVRGGAGAQVVVRVILPGAGPLADLLDVPDVDDLGFFEAPGSRAVVAYHAARALEKLGRLSHGLALELRDVIASDVLLIGSLADGKGGFRFWRTAQASPYLTARALEGLAAARETNFPVPAEVLAGAGDTILAAVGKDGLVDGADIAFWEGRGEDRRVALSAVAFRAIAEAGPDAVSKTRGADFDRLRARLERALVLTDDPLAIANIGLGLLGYQSNFVKQPMELDTARRLLRRSLESRSRGHWEPSWFHGLGGTIEATALTLELVYLLDPAQAQPVVEEAVAQLVAARRRMRAWHDASGMAALARAIAALPLNPEPRATEVVVELGGKKVIRKYIGAATELDVSAELAHLELPALDETEQELVVRYSGRSGATVVVETGRWVEEPPPGTTSLRVERRFPASLRVGEASEVTLALTAPEAQERLTLEELLPAGLEVDEASLAALVASKKIVDYRVGKTLRLLVGRVQGSVSLPYKVKAAQRGELRWGPTSAWPTDQPEKGGPVGGSGVVRVE